MGPECQEVPELRIEAQALLQHLETTDVKNVGTNNKVNIYPIYHKMLTMFPTPSNLQNMEADIGPDGTVVGMRLLVGMHIKQADGPVSLHAAFLTEDQQSTRSTDFQVMREKEGDGLADQ